MSEYAPRMKDGKPFPPDPEAPKEAGRGNPQTKPLGTPSAEALELNRAVTALRAAIKLVAVHAGRVVTVCTGAPIPPEEAHNRDDDAPQPGTPRITADAYAIHASMLLNAVNQIDGNLYTFAVQTFPLIEEAKRNALA